MSVFIRAVVTGFGFQLGSALYKRVSAKLGLDESDATPDPDTADGDPSDDPADDLDAG